MITAEQFIREASTEGCVHIRCSSGKEACELLWSLRDHASYDGSSDAYSRTFDGADTWCYDLWGTHEGRDWSGKITYPKGT